MDDLGNPKQILEKFVNKNAIIKPKKGYAPPPPGILAKIRNIYDSNTEASSFDE